MRFRDKLVLDPEFLGQLIRTARERCGLSQEELAVLISRDQRAVSEYERGRRRISVTDLPRIAHALKVPILYFFEGESDLDDLDMELISEFHNLPTSEARQAAIEVIRTLSKLVNPQSE